MQPEREGGVQGEEVADTGVTPYPAKLNSPQTEAFNTRLLTTPLVNSPRWFYRIAEPDHARIKNLKTKWNQRRVPLVLPPSFPSSSLAFAQPRWYSWTVESSLQITFPCNAACKFLAPSFSTFFSSSLSLPLSLPLFVFSEFACETSSPISPCVCVCPVWLPAAHHFLSEQDGPRMPASSWLCDILSAFSAPLPRCSSARLLLCCDCRRGWEKVVSSTAAQIGQRRKYLLGIGPAGQCWPPLSTNGSRYWLDFTSFSIVLIYTDI